MCNSRCRWSMNRSRQTMSLARSVDAGRFRILDHRVHHCLGWSPIACRNLLDNRGRPDKEQGLEKRPGQYKDDDRSVEISRTPYTEEWEKHSPLQVAKQLKEDYGYHHGGIDTEYGDLSQVSPPWLGRFVSKISILCLLERALMPNPMVQIWR